MNRKSKRRYAAPAVLSAILVVAIVVQLDWPDLGPDVSNYQPDENAIHRPADGRVELPSGDASFNYDVGNDLVESANDGSRGISRDEPWALVANETEAGVSHVMLSQYPEGLPERYSRASLRRSLGRTYMVGPHTVKHRIVRLHGRKAFVWDWWNSERITGFINAPTAIGIWYHRALFYEEPVPILYQCRGMPDVSADFERRCRKGLRTLHFARRAD